MDLRNFASGMVLGVFLLMSHFSTVQAVCPCQKKTKNSQPQAATFKNQQSQKELLIVGCPRSGTIFAATVLRRCGGLDIGHEKIRSQGVVSWLFSANSAKPAWGPLPTKYQFKHVFHQVRHPLKCIATMHLVLPEAWEYICREAPEIKVDDPLLVRTAKMWVYWNLKAEKRAEMTYRVESMESILPEMGKRLGIALDLAVLKKISTTTHSRNSNFVVSWSDLAQALEPSFYKQLVLLAERYGYDVTEGKALLQ
jgi:hypothetical protein